MPKIVDHDQRREEIALKAAGVFLEFGYKELGMRQLCSHLNMSKSAVYHYYKSKDELFKAATEAIVRHDGGNLSELPLAVEATTEQKIENFVQIFQAIESRHFQEMKLVFDYIDVIGQDAVAQDPSMAIANEKYQQLIARYVDEKNALPLFSILIGLLTHQTLCGGTLETDHVRSVVSKQIDK
ncbi:TetR/AcrR family transcriptional regulator [Vibrio splendidus]|uniref:TetR/AcrR family transcriptional regulator n=1 Tax=Vibrio splendidus TaxID=29497 RepID=UPI001BFFF0B4|nr:TetR/AcrR family transcriptional regulator [Vibrio splendidus]MBT9243437.1 TetR/AcrR family transcriptional regulator [Vibrio splendidus]MDP2614664.1 TetR/AcrR family transcriptional regulator [Vibrio splendidus]